MWFWNTTWRHGLGTGKEVGLDKLDYISKNETFITVGREMISKSLEL